MRFKRSALALVIPALLAGCGSDDSPDISEFVPPPEEEVPPPPEPTFANGDLQPEPSLVGEIPDGVYRVSLSEVDGTSTGNRVESLGTALISDTGRIAVALDQDNRTAVVRIALDEQGDFEARWLDTQNNFGEDILVRGSRDRVSGSTGVRVSGTLVGRDNQTLLGTYQLDKQARDGQVTRPADVAATYRTTIEGVTTAFELRSDGTVVGTDTSGCEFVGQFVVPEPQENLIEMQLEADRCGPTETITAPERNGTYFALATLDREQSSLFMLAANDNVALRFFGRDVSVPVVQPPEPVGPPVFVSDNLENDPSVESRLSPGVYQYADITPQEPPEDGEVAPIPDSGVAYLSSTGRLVFQTRFRTLGARVTVSDAATFRSPASERLEPIPEDEDREPEASTQVEVFGTPDTSSGGAEQIVGSILNEGSLRNRFRLSRNASASDSGLSDSDIVGIYQQRQAGGFNTTLTITQGSGDGPGEATLNGSDTTGCIYNGDVKIPDATANVVEMRFTLSGTCTPNPQFPDVDRSGTYNAIGTLDKSGSIDQLNIVSISAENILRFSGQKQ